MKAIANSVDTNPNSGKISYLWENKDGSYALYSQYAGKYLKLTQKHLITAFGKEEGRSLWKLVKKLP